MKVALSDFSSRKKGIYGILHVIILLLPLFLAINISIDTSKGIPFYTQSVHVKVQLWIRALFLSDFILELFFSKSKWYYLSIHFIFLLMAISYQNIISYMGWTFPPEVTYMIRSVLLVWGGYAMAIVIGWLTYNKTSGLSVSYLTMLPATVYFSSLALFVLEHKVNPLVTGYGDASWWVSMDVTMVGSNIITVTVTGRVLSVLLAALDTTMFPTFTVYVTSLIQKKNKEKEEHCKQLEAADDNKQK